MSARYNPFEELEQMFTRMSRHFAEAPHSWEDPGTFLDTSNRQTFPVDLVDEGESFVATVDLPGFDRADVTITLQNSTLHIDADREVSSDDSEEHYVRRERTVQSLNRAVQLPTEIDEDAVMARMNNGVLTITLPKIDTDEATSVDIVIE